MTDTHDANEGIKAGNLFGVDGLVAVITGGGSGLGAYMARALAVNGAAKVYILGRRLATLEATVASVPGSSNIRPVQADVTSKESLEAAVAAIRADGTAAIDVLIANSGVAGPSTPTTNPADGSPLSADELAHNLWSQSVADVTATFSTNVIGVYFTVAAFLPLLTAANRQRGAGDGDGATLRPRPQIITTGSVAAFSRQALGNLTYGPSKAGVVHLTKQLATLLVPHDIRANVIAPGLYLTDMTEEIMGDNGKPSRHNAEGMFAKSVIPATRSGDDKDMAGAVLYLCSRAGAYVNGQVVLTDGGRVGVLPATY